MALALARTLPAELRHMQLEIEGHARAYGLDCFDVIFELVDSDELNEIAAGTGGEVIGFGSDLSVVEGCESAVEYISKHEDKLHILINNAGATVRARDARTARSDPPFALGGASPDRTHSR